jgi:Lar family restriction alleviation protein
MSENQTTDDLLPCPFCGSSKVWLGSERDHDAAYICCDACGAVLGGSGWNDEQAIAGWNRRPREYTREEMREACEANYKAGYEAGKKDAIF